MRILFINSIQMFGGGEVWLLSVMHEMRARGHRVYLLCRPKIQLYDKARARGFDVYTIKIRGDFDPFTIWKTWRLIRSLNVDVLCTNMDKELRFGGLAAKIAGVRAIIPRRGIDYPLKNTWAYRLSYNKLASGIIANSKSTKESLLLNTPWLNPQKIKIIYNGVDPKRFSENAKKNLRRIFGIKRDDFLVGFVGQLNERKGVDTLISAFCSFSHKYNKSCLLLVGEGEMENQCRKLAQSCHGKVIFAGYREDIDDLMKTIDVLVLPSLWEGFGIVLIEAMAAGKPVITTKVSNMPEIVTDKVEGFLISPGDENALEAGLLKLYQNRILIKVMGKAGQRRVQNQFTKKKMIDETEQYFQKLSARNEP